MALIARVIPGGCGIAANAEQKTKMRSSKLGGEMSEEEEEEEGRKKEITSGEKFFSEIKRTKKIKRIQSESKQIITVPF